MCPFKQRNMSVMTREPISLFNFDLLQTHGFALFLRCWWMEASDIPAGLRHSVTSLVYKLYAFSGRLTPAF